MLVVIVWILRGAYLSQNEPAGSGNSLICVMLKFLLLTKIWLESTEQKKYV